MSCSLDPDEAGHSVGPDFGLYCLHHTTTASKRVKPPTRTAADVFLVWRENTSFNPDSSFPYPLHDECSGYGIAGLPRSGKKFWKMKNFPGQGKVRDYIFSQGNLKKMKKKVMEKSGNFEKISKKMLVNRLLEILVSIICKQFMFRNIPFLIFMV